MKSLLNKFNSLSRSLVNDMWRFGTVGLVSTIIDFAFLNIFTHFHITIFWSIFFAYLIGSINGYLLNNNWTYRHLGKSNTVLGFSQYASISFIGLALTEGIVELLLMLFHTDVNVNKLVAVVVVFFWNFFANRHLTFRHKSKPAGE